MDAIASRHPVDFQYLNGFANRNSMIPLVLETYASRAGSTIEIARSDRWEEIDEISAILLVPFERDEENFLERFDLETGLIDTMETMRFCETGDDRPKDPLDLSARK